MIQNVNSCSLNVTSLIHELATGNRDVTITIVHVWFTWKLSYHNGMKPQWFKEFVKRTSVPSFASFITKKICGSLNCLTSGVIINWPRAMCMAQLDTIFGHIAATVQHHWDNMPMWLSRPCFQAPLHNFPQLGCRHASLNTVAASNAFSCSFANDGHRNSIQLSNLCTMYWKSHF